MKKSAWTIVETVVALIIITMISGYCVVSFRPNAQKSKYYVYAVINNLTKGNVALLDRYNSVNEPPANVSSKYVKFSIIKIGDVIWTTRNAGDPGGPEIPSSVKICTAGESCAYGGTTPTCWQGTTATVCTETDPTGYSGCTRTACNWYAANIICSHNKMTLPSIEQFSNLRENPASSGSLYNQYTVSICDSTSGSASYSRCGAGSGVCNGAYNNSCYSYAVWGPVNGANGYHFNLNSGGLYGAWSGTQQYSHSVRCTSTDDLSMDDWYCSNLADNFSLTKSANCSMSAKKDDVNLEFPNGVTIKGLASPWAKPYADSDFEYKNILVDIDGTKGVNKLWADQFPLRIIGGTGRGAQGLIMPVNCADDKVYNKSTETLVDVAPGAKNPYCPSSNGKNYTLDDTVITYDIYKAKDKTENAQATLIASGLSAFEADCKAYGSKKGYFSVEECNSAKIRISPICATQESCTTCTADTCPEGSTDAEGCKAIAEEKNPEDITCVTLLHKPSGGISVFLQALIGDVDNL